MDIDIDDILAELDRDTTAVDHGTSTPAADTSDIQNDSTRVHAEDTHTKHVCTPEKDYQALVTHWRNERMCPELLPYPHLLMGRVLQRVQEQMEHIECLSMGFLDDGGHQADNLTSKLPLLCMEAELERLKFVIRSFVRCRLAKVDKYGLYLRQLETIKDSPVPLDELLSSQELVYYEKHSAILLKLLNNTILKHMPLELQAVDDTEGSVNMIEEPQWSKFVFVLVTGGGYDDPALETNEQGQMCYAVSIKELNEEVELAVGGIYVLRYNVVRDLLREGKVVLI